MPEYLQTISSLVSPLTVAGQTRSSHMSADCLVMQIYLALIVRTSRADELQNPLFFLRRTASPNPVVLKRILGVGGSQRPAAVDRVFSNLSKSNSPSLPKKGRHGVGHMSAGYKGCLVTNDSILARAPRADSEPTTFLLGEHLRQTQSSCNHAETGQPRVCSVPSAVVGITPKVKTPSKLR